MKDEKAIAKMRQGDSEGLQVLMNRYIPYVSAVVWGILRGAMTPQDAEEVVSDVFLAAWARAEDLQCEKIKAWLGAVARHKAKNKLRQLGQTLPLDEDVLEVPDDGFGSAARAEERELVRRALDSLSREDREIFLRHYYYAQTVAEIGAEMRINAATVKTRLRRGRIRLKEYLTGGNSYET